MYCRRRGKKSGRARFYMRVTSVTLLSASLLVVGGALPSNAASPRYETQDAPLVIHQRYPIASTSAAESERIPQAVKWGLGAAAVAVGACALLGCFSGDDDAPASFGGSVAPRYNSPQVMGSDEEVREDTSIGCAWGDRAYGTCQ